MMVGQGRNMIDQTVADRETNGEDTSSLNGIAQRIQSAWCYYYSQ